MHTQRGRGQTFDFKIKHEEARTFSLAAGDPEQCETHVLPYLRAAVQIELLEPLGRKISRNSGDVRPYAEAKGQAVERAHKVFYKPRS